MRVSLRVPSISAAFGILVFLVTSSFLDQGWPDLAASERKTLFRTPPQQGASEPIGGLTDLCVYPFLPFFLSFSINPIYPQIQPERPP